MRRAIAVLIVFAVLTFTHAAPASAGNAPMRLLILGDSLAFGQGASDPRRSFAFLLYRFIAARRPGRIVTNHAVGGARIADVTRLELGDLPSHVDLLLIEAGANDVVHGVHAATVMHDAEILIARVRNRYPHARIVLCGIPDLSISPLFVGAQHAAVARLSREDDAALRAVAARYRLAFIDVFSLSHRIRGRQTAFLSGDDFHPSDRGHAAIAALIESTLGL